MASDKGGFSTRSRETFEASPLRASIGGNRAESSLGMSMDTMPPLSLLGVETGNSIYDWNEITLHSGREPA
jgi:hypothetical protein